MADDLRRVLVRLFKDRVADRTSVVIVAVVDKSDRRRTRTLLVGLDRERVPISPEVVQECLITFRGTKLSPELSTLIEETLCLPGRT